VKPTATDIDNEPLRWSLSWQPDGCCNTFTREAILACAPPASGVYGLFNFDCQIFIGASVNIREALLRHESETDFQSAHLRPTGFTFEPCAAELCKPKVDDLIVKFRPVLQSEAVLTETWALANAPMASDVRQSGNEIKIHTDHHEFPAHESERQTKARRRFRFNRLAAALAAIVVASALVIFYLGMPADYAIQKRANGANPAPAQGETGLRPQNVSSIDIAGGLANQSAVTTPAKLDVHASASTQNTAVRLAAKSASAADQASTQATTPSIAHTAESKHLNKKWSVQISAVPAKDVANTLVQQLKAKGHDGYSVQTEVKGQTYYRVRVGHFDAREEAEVLRQSLARQEGYRDAYLTGD
jgi:cell division septation protein DedD